MTKEKFLLICEFYKAIELRQEAIAQVLECSFDGNSSVELTYQFLVNLFKAEGFDADTADCVMDNIGDIVYDIPCYIIDDNLNKKFKCESFEELYDLIF